MALKWFRFVPATDRESISEMDFEIALGRWLARQSEIAPQGWFYKGSSRSDSLRRPFSEASGLKGMQVDVGGKPYLQGSVWNGREYGCVVDVSWFFSPGGARSRLVVRLGDALHSGTAHLEVGELVRALDFVLAYEG